MEEDRARLRPGLTNAVEVGVRSRTMCGLMAALRLTCRRGSKDKGLNLGGSALFHSLRD
jgi:hypothetical protein